MKSPIIKSLKIPSGQEIEMSSKGIVVKCAGGTVRIEVLKSGRINLYAQKEIQMAVDENFSVNAKRRFKILGGENILLKADQGGSLTLDENGNITVTGVEAHMN